MVKTIEIYVCDHCGSEYRSKRVAAICESWAVPDAPHVKVGDKVFVFRDDYGWEEREVAEVYLDSMLEHTNGHVVDDDDSAKHVSYLETIKREHEWLVRVGMTPWWKTDPCPEDFQSFSLDHVKATADATAALDGSTRLASRK